MKATTRTQLAFKLALPVIFASGIFAQTLNAAPAASVDPAFTQQLSDLQTKAAQLQGTLAQNAPNRAAPSMPDMGAPAASASPMAGMSGGAAGAMKPAGTGDDKMMMGKMDQMMKEMDKMMPMMDKMMGGGAMPASAPAMSNGTGMGMDKMDMAGMMSMGAMPAAAPGVMLQSALPGFPGASHLYHVGATGFFLDHPEHITLTTDQQVGLNKMKDQALLAKSAAERSMEQAEQELALLTAADQPDIAKIELKVREIAKLAGDQRLAFIRAVGEAARLLTADQRKSLTGFAPASPAVALPAPAAAPATPDPMAGGMKDM